MTNKVKFLVIIGIIISIGAALLFYGSQSITADIVIQEGEIDKTNSMIIDATLDPEINVKGVFAVQTLEENQENISASILDPFGTKIITRSIDKNSFEDIFEISINGVYTLVIETQSDEMISVVGGIGHVPDSSSYSISIVGFLMLLSGMIGVLVLGIILVKDRKKRIS